jgi:N-glycosylase/DNA lyase
MLIYCMRTIASKVESLKKSKISNVIKRRMRDFSEVEDLFSEMCFCLLAFNYSAAGAARIQEEIGEEFHTLTEEELVSELKELGYRFPVIRAKYIVEARKHVKDLKKIVQREDARVWLIKNVKGFGMKVASHFLRNVGRPEYAILDFHIVDLLVNEGLIKRPKTLTVKKYLEIEKVLKKVAREVNLSMGELDFYLWYLETGKVLK